VDPAPFARPRPDMDEVVHQLEEINPEFCHSTTVDIGLIRMIS